MSETVRLAQERLSHNGFRPGPIDGYMGSQTRRAVRLFQEAFHGIPGSPDVSGRLTVNGSLDRLTRIALSHNGRLSANFWAREFACKHCGVVTVHRDLIAALQTYRSLLGRGVTVISGTRCYIHNRNVGGATRSQHLAREPGVYTSAADIRGEIHYSRVRRVLPRGGLGFRGSTGNVQHIDIGPTRSWTY